MYDLSLSLSLSRDQWAVYERLIRGRSQEEMHVAVRSSRAVQQLRGKTSVVTLDDRLNFASSFVAAPFVLLLLAANSNFRKYPSRASSLRVIYSLHCLHVTSMLLIASRYRLSRAAIGERFRDEESEFESIVYRVYSLCSFAIFICRMTIISLRRRRVNCNFTTRKLRRITEESNRRQPSSRLNQFILAEVNLPLLYL